jgi:hypothetical protein
MLCRPKQLRDIPLRGAFRSVRIAQFSAEPFVTRVVLDLKFMKKYEISSIGNKVVVRVNLEQVPSQSNDAEPKQ